MADFINNNSLNNNAFQRGSNNLRPSKPFGLNVKVPERTIKQIGETVKSNTTSGIVNIFNYLKVNEQVFDGTVERSLDSLFVQQFNTERLMAAADPNANVGRKFEMDM